MDTIKADQLGNLLALAKQADISYSECADILDEFMSDKIDFNKAKCKITLLWYDELFGKL